MDDPAFASAKAARARSSTLGVEVVPFDGPFAVELLGCELFETLLMIDSDALPLPLSGSECVFSIARGADGGGGGRDEWGGAGGRRLLLVEATESPDEGGSGGGEW